ncbi:MAG: hypothetical protein OXC83_04420 [Chloroflexi bacterium]|nr:hypothetical protein [Chloroflexota bacterium]
MTSSPTGSTRPNRINITETKQLLVEGNDDLRVFRALIETKSVSDIQIQVYGGKQNLKSFLRNFVEDDNFENVTSIGIHRDADTNANDAERSIHGTLDALSLPKPSSPLTIAQINDLPSIVYLVVPHYKNNGSIEDVCLDSVNDQDILGCVEGYMECLESVSPDEFVATPKARTYAYLASRKPYNLRVGEAADAGEWNFEAESFEPLRNLIELL